MEDHMTTPLELCLIDQVDEAVHRRIAAPILQYNEDLAGPARYRALAITLRGTDTDVPGGLCGYTTYGWLFIGSLFVPAALRGHGIGARLMAQAEHEAQRRGCHAAWVDTFQARGFYERLGYTCFGEQSDFPLGFVRSFLQKPLREAPATDEAANSQWVQELGKTCSQ
jgi:GNAT superfamily N-acetyltransferase